MEENDEEPKIDQTSDKTLSDLRDLSIQCRALLHQLPANAGPEAGELMASFNIWTANMGVFREGRQSLTSRLKSAPEISELVQQLLTALKRDLEKIAFRLDSKESSSASESDDSSDRSSISSYKQPQVSENLEAFPPRTTIWTSIQNTITSLRQLALAVRRAGAQHRQERIQRFKNIERNKEVYQLIERCARQKVDHMFPNASEVLRKRMAESIATRRTRFSYLEQHQKKTSTLNEPAPELQQDETNERKEGTALPKIELAQQRIANLESRMRPQPSIVLSATAVTKLDLRGLNPTKNKLKRTESVSSVKISTGKFPSMPKLDSGHTSFTCPYCFLVCPAKEASGESQWMSHLIHDFEPFFCVFDECTSPFTCTDMYTGWLAHMRETHTQPEWHCWHCKTSSSSGPFSTPSELESHLESHHREEITESLRPTLVKHSMIHDQHPLQECPFCGGFPEEIEKTYPDRDGKQSHEALEKHVRDHLVSVALILAPVEMGESGDELDDTKSNAQRDDDSERDLDGVGDTYELQCQNTSCDCKEESGFDCPENDAWEVADVQAVSNITQLWQYILSEKTSGEGADPTLEAFAANSQLDISPLIIDVPYARGNPDDDIVELQEDKAIEYLVNLYFTDPRKDKKHVEKIRGGLLPDVHHWIYLNPEFRQWRDKSQSRLLSIPGGPGTGKTMLLCSIINDLEKEPDNLVAYYFCTATDSEFNYAAAVLRGLIYMLVIRKPSLLSHVRENVNLFERPLIGPTEGWVMTSVILSDIFRDPDLSNTILIIDNFDKCTEHREELLYFIKTSPFNIKWVMSSQDPADYVEQSVTAHLELNQESNSAAIRTYIQHKVNMLAEQKQYDESTKNDVQDYLVSNASGNFIWVLVACQKLGSANNDDVARVIGMKHTSLRGAYDRVMSLIQHQEERDREMCRQVLATVAIAYGPIHLEELGYLSGLPPHIQRSYDDMTRIISLCGSFLTIEDNRVRISHQSVKEYLLSSAHLFPSDGEGQQHREVFLGSLAVLSEMLRRDMYSLGNPGILMNEVSPPIPNPLNAIEYSCIYWIDHFLAADPDNELSSQYGEAIYTFMKTKFLYWLESLSILRKMEEVDIPGMLLELIHNARNLEKIKGLGKLLTDAHQFLRLHGSNIAIAPLQVYVSSLVFSSRNDSVREHFIKEVPDWIVLRRFMDLASSTVLLAFSTDGQRLALVSMTQDITIRGLYSDQRVIVSYYRESVTSMTFSSDDRQLAISSTLGIEVFDTTTGALLRGFAHTRSATVVLLAFSTDGQRLASGATDNTIDVWDLITDTCLQTITVGNRPTYLSFDSTNNSRLSTDTVSINLDLSPENISQAIEIISPELLHSNDETSIEDRWIMRNGQRMVLLPTNYSSSAIRERTVAIGVESGGVYIIEFS
ncbi:hypothetical protein F4805DRAFT_441186 [Annulohypoxylon moriforme]|nr:hypothetical protein F4805DRAFT_441186 [Annulohypoxylon moriforme]